MARVPYLLGLAAILLLSGCTGKPEGNAGVDVEKIRDADARAKVDAGREALEAKRYDDAIACLEEARRLSPGDKTARTLLTRAKQEKLDALMDAGRAALEKQDYERTVAAMDDALKLTNDEAVQALRTAAVVNIWRKAGAEVGWMRVKNDGLVFFIEFEAEGFVPEKKYDYYRGFKFRSWKPGVLAKLPAPDGSFGLDLSNTTFGDEGVKELAALGGVYILNVSFTNLTEAGKENLRKTITVQWLSR